MGCNSCKTNKQDNIQSDLNSRKDEEAQIQIQFTCRLCWNKFEIDEEIGIKCTRCGHRLNKNLVHRASVNRKRRQKGKYRLN